MKAMPLLALALLVHGCKDGDKRPAKSEPAAGAERSADDAGQAEPTGPLALPEPAPVPRAPRGLPPLPSPRHNPTTAAKVELGRVLFFDPRLSASGQTACASCHQPAHMWSHPEERRPTDSGQDNLRHAPSLANTAYAREWGWDGAMPTLEAHILAHWKGQLGGERDRIVADLAAAPDYAARFQRSFGGRRSDMAEPTIQKVAEALAAYVRTLLAGDSSWDAYEAGDTDAVTADAVAGSAVFNERAGCAHCHSPPLYTDNQYHDRKVSEQQLDPGRARVTGDAEDQGAFRTPGLRGGLSAPPYFHDGSVVTLEAAIDHELAQDNIELTAEEKRQLLAFLQHLAGEPAAR